MLSAHQITKTYGIHTVLQDITFSINPGDRLGPDRAEWLREIHPAAHPGRAGKA